jgi:NADPH-dependent glutamate synthase beta subunit-like oxidoreductase/NAD-dependent dihydropyrimidine dehydrogenase PreA subunit
MEEPIAICALKRFATDEARKKRDKRNNAGSSPAEGPRVAIIGSGPAGLTAAHDLATGGFRPTLIEAEDKPGGFMRHAIAPFRLPRDILEEEIEDILALGVDLRLNTSIGSLEDLEKLKTEGFEAILLATGTSKDLTLNIDGENLEGIYGCVNLLKRLWNDNCPESLGKVVVIGGGNAAVEAARANVRSGAESVYLVCLEKREEMPAWEYEIQEALEEGVTIINGLGPRRFLEKDERVSGIEFKRCTAVFDDKGAFNPQYDETDLTAMEADTAIIAIGQAVGLSFVEKERRGTSDGTGGDLKSSSRGTIKVSPGGETNIPGIYASGDVVSGPSTVVEAMASGRRAAQMILNAFQPAERPAQMEGSESSRREYEPIPKELPREERSPLSHREVSARISDNEEVIGAFSAQEAIKEASRCLQCGVCSECLRCQVACELGAIRHERTSTLRALQFEQIIVADDSQMVSNSGGFQVVRMSDFAKKGSWAKAMVAGRVAAMEALTEVPAAKTGPIPTRALGGGDLRVGVFVCSCNDTLNGDGRLGEMVAPLEGTPFVAHSEVLLSACHPEKGKRIEEVMREKGLNGALIASCTCCHLDFVCESCNDQRIRLKHRLFRETGYDPRDIALVNIKETCLVPFKEDRTKGTDLAMGVIRSGLWQLREHKEWSLKRQEPQTQVLILGATEAGLAAARSLKDGFASVVVVDDQEVEGKIQEELRGQGVDLVSPVRPIRLDGQRGDFTLIVEKKEAVNPSEGEGRLKGLSRSKDKWVRSAENEAFDGDPRYQKISGGTVILGRSEFKNIFYHRDAFSRDVHLGTKGAFGTLETAIPGVYMASWSQARNVPEEAMGKAAASEALEEIIGKAHPFDDLVAHVDTELCRGCGGCADICPEGAARLQEIGRGVACSRIEPVLCTGCGNCIAECPTGAISLPECEQAYFEKVMDVYLG